MDDLVATIGKACEWIDGYEDAMRYDDDYTIPRGNTPYEVGYREALSVRALVTD